MRRSPTIRWVVLLLLVAGCSAASGGPAGSDPALRTLQGQVDFGTGRSSQATVGEIANAATVSIIDPTTDQTRITTVTTPTGHFNLNLAGLDLSQPYYVLEAVKGLHQNAVGHDAARVRTLIRRDTGGWLSITNSVPGADIRLDASTTALCIVMSLRSSTPSPVSPLSLIGSISLGDGSPLFGSGPASESVTPQEYSWVSQLVQTALRLDVDPVDAVIMLGANYSLRPEFGEVFTVGYVTPLGAVGAEVTILGSGFGTSPSVLFSESATSTVPGTLLAVSGAALRVRVPPGAISGPVSVQVGAASLSIPFQVLPAVSGGIRS